MEGVRGCPYCHGEVEVVKLIKKKEEKSTEPVENKEKEETDDKTGSEVIKPDTKEGEDNE